MDSSRGPRARETEPARRTSLAGLMASDFLERMRSVGYLSRGRTRDRVREGRSHPDSGKPYKATTDELGGTVTEHGTPGTGVSSRQDAHIRPATITYDLRDRR
jgi:hypothetical protein